MIRRILSLFATGIAVVALSNCSAPAPNTAGWDALKDSRNALGYRPSSPNLSVHEAELARRDKKIGSPSVTSDRPGLATGWGPRRDAKVGTTVFEREPGKPVGVAKVFYNNATGALAMAGGDYSHSTSFRDYSGGLFRLGLRNHRSAALSAYQSGGNLICVGEDGQRYSVEVENLSGNRLEFVVTVDGLDVLSGEAGAYSRRGYILQPGESYEIKGWRTSLNDVADFKFGKVPDSVAVSKTGDSKNVGVVGCAVFAERGTSPRPYTGTEANRRLHADPFVASPVDGRFAKPPVSR